MPELSGDEIRALHLLRAVLDARPLAEHDTPAVGLCARCGTRNAGTFAGRVALCYPCSTIEAFRRQHDEQRRQDVGMTRREFTRHLSRHGQLPPKPTRLDW